MRPFFSGNSLDLNWGGNCFAGIGVGDRVALPFLLLPVFLGNLPMIFDCLGSLKALVYKGLRLISPNSPENLYIPPSLLLVGWFWVYPDSINSALSTNTRNWRPAISRLTVGRGFPESRSFSVFSSKPLSVMRRHSVDAEISSGSP